MSQDTPLFANAQLAKGYAQKRPYFHPQVIRRIGEYIGIEGRLERALDVGCGAGLSSLALLEIAAQVVGVDASAAMVAAAIAHPDIEYCNCAAEDLPLEGEFGLITLAGSINWVDRPRFFSAAKRLLAPRSYVIIYDNTILGTMATEEGFARWYEGQYLVRYPKPPRDESPLTAAEVAGYGFDFVGAEDYTNQVQFELAGFVDYLFTQSNITAALGAAGEGAGQIRDWLKKTLAPFFRGGEQSLDFGGYICYVQNRPGPGRGKP